MSGVAIIRYILANNVSITSVIPASMIQAGDLPINTELPGISITTISSINRATVAIPSTFNTDRVQVTVEAKTYPQIKSILTLIRNAFLTYSGGTYNSIVCDSIVRDIVGPDIFDQQTGIYAQSQDFIVNWYS